MEFGDDAFSTLKETADDAHTIPNPKACVWAQRIPQTQTVADAANLRCVNGMVALIPQEA